MRTRLLILLAAANLRMPWAGSNVWSSAEPGDGTIAVLAVDPGNSGTVYAGVGGNGGGIFKTCAVSTTSTAIHSGNN
jgi:hypothetical protein